MNSPSDRKNSPSANDFPSLGQFSPFIAQNFISLTPPPLTPMAPLAITLPLFYKPSTGSQPDASDSACSFPVRGDGSGQSGQRRSNEITSGQFTRMALRGCEIAEKIVQNHKTRPCFKKIDSLCARLKQDLVRPDNVLANINSQGIAWAVKDMIFTFTRILNAWIIVKGYMHDTPAGLKKVKEYCSEDFDESFYKWQEATIDFLGNLTDSFERLDCLVQTQKNRFGSGKKDEKEFTRKRSSNASTESRESDLLDDFANMSMMLFPSERKIKNEEEGSGYIRTGIYNPLQTTRSNVQIDPDQLLQWEHSVFSQRTSTPIAVESPVKLTTKTSPEYVKDKSKDPKEYGIDPEETLILILLAKLYEMKDASLFFNKHFTKNYVPDYVASAFTCKDTKTIMIGIEKRSYKTLLAIVKDLAAIIYDAKAYLKKNPDNDFLATNTYAFENELKTILNEEIFSIYNLTDMFINP